MSDTLSQELGGCKISTANCKKMWGLESGGRPDKFTRMSITGLIASALLKPTTLPVDPDPSMFAIGRKLALRKRPIEDCLGRDDVTVGKWFDGKKPHAIEHVIWLSPDLLARWFGYLKTVESWQEGDCERRWLVLRSKMTSKRWFVVQLGCFEKQDPLEMESPKRPPLERLDAPEISVKTPNSDLNPRIVGDFDMYSRDPKKLVEIPWYATTDVLDFLRPIKTPRVDPGYPLGWNRTRLFVIETDSAPSATIVDIHAGDKSWKARFSPIRG